MANLDKSHGTFIACLERQDGTDALCGKITKNKRSKNITVFLPLLLSYFLLIQLNDISGTNILHHKIRLCIWGSEQNVSFCHNVSLSNEARPISCLRMQASVFYANVTVHLLSQERVSFLLF